MAQKIVIGHPTHPNVQDVTRHAWSADNSHVLSWEKDGAYRYKSDGWYEVQLANDVTKDAVVDDCGHITVDESLVMLPPGFEFVSEQVYALPDDWDKLVQNAMAHTDGGMSLMQLALFLERFRVVRLKIDQIIER